MNILFDFVHPADVNFFSNTINRLVDEGHDITCTVLRRGRLPLIVKKEFPRTDIRLLGKHRKGVLGKIGGMALRELGFLRLYLSRKYDAVVGFGFYAGMLAWLRGSRSVHVHDDKEYKANFRLTKLFAKRFIALCPASGRNVRRVKSYKELAYLAPAYYEEDVRVLKRLGLTKGKYVYVREIANISVNYAGTERVDYGKLFAYCRGKGLTILYDPEGKPTYKDVKLLKGVFSLQEHNAIKKHAALIITSGDTVLREGALLGTPTVYTSDRVMEINKGLEGLFRTAHGSDELLAVGKELLTEKSSLEKKAAAFARSCEDINAILYEEVIGS